MINEKLLNRELVRLVVSIVGCNLTSVNGSAVTAPVNAVDADLRLTLPNRSVKVLPAWAATTKFGLRVLLTQIVDEHNEYHLVYRLGDEGPIIGIGHVCHDNGFIIFKKYDNGKWFDLPLKDKLSIAADFVATQDSHIRWEKCEKYLDLIEPIKELISYE